LSAAAKPEAHVTAVAGSSEYLVFVRFAVTATGGSAKVGSLLVMDRSGRTRKLVAVPRDYGEIGQPSLAGNTLLVPLVAHSAKLMLFNLSTGQHKGLSRSQGDLLPVAAAPDGYLGVVKGSSPARFVRVAWSGSRTNFGAPFKDCRAVSIEPGPTGFVAAGAREDPEESSCHANDWGVKSALFDQPKKYYTLAPDVGSVGCGSSGGRYVLCGSSPRCTLTVKTLQGRVENTAQVRPCPGPSVTADQRVFWLSDDGPHGAAVLYELDGKKVTHARSYFVYDSGLVSAFGKAIVCERGRHHLLAFASAHGKPHRLV
jgi:hypothetical protein